MGLGQQVAVQASVRGTCTLCDAGAPLCTCFNDNPLLFHLQVVINPKDNNTFATASLDRTIKVWQFGSAQPNFTLSGHEKGVNCVDYYRGGDKPYLISGADDKTVRWLLYCERLAISLCSLQVKIWDYQNKTCVITFDGHVRNVSAVCFHPELPIIISGSEDSTLRLWHATTYRLETTLNYGVFAQFR